MARLTLLLPVLAVAISCTSRQSVSISEIELLVGVETTRVPDLEALASRLQQQLVGADCDARCTVEGGGGDSAVLVILEEHCQDDSVEAFKTWVRFLRNSDASYRAVGAERAWRCWPDRGHSTFGTRPCS